MAKQLGLAAQAYKPAEELGVSSDSLYISLSVRSHSDLA